MIAPAPTPDATVPAVRMTGISKSFGGVRALDTVDLEVLPGEVHATTARSKWQATSLPPPPRKRRVPPAWQ